MYGAFTLDGNDAYAYYGAFVVDKGFNGVAQWPGLKSYDENNWHEEDGVEADLSSPVLNTRDLTITFGFDGANKNVYAFIVDLLIGSYHTFAFTGIGRTLNLRLVSSPSINDWESIAELKLTFADDFPLNGYTRVSPETCIDEPLLFNGNVLYFGDEQIVFHFDGVPALDANSCEECTIDETKLVEYGVRLLDGTLNNVRKVADVKKGLLRNISVVSGAEYDPYIAYDGTTKKNVPTASKTVTLKCVALALNFAQYWRNMDVLLYDLTQPGSRELYIDAYGKTLDVAYSSMSVSDFGLYGKVVVCRFDLTLKVLADRPATES